MVNCKCGHPQGWHWRGTGSCLECDCMVFGVKENKTVDDILEEGLVCDVSDCDEKAIWFKGTRKLCRHHCHEEKYYLETGD